MSKNEEITFNESTGNVTLIKGGKSAVEIFVDSNGTDYKGLRLVAQSLADDIRLVSGVKPEVATDAGRTQGIAIIAGSIGNNRWIDSLIADNIIDVSSIRNKRETYIIQVIDHPFPETSQAIVIAGSDKRGTVYGMYRISELIGVSPWVYWADVQPEQKKELVIPREQLDYVSKEPSIKYRGFFINDEWPSFGSWTMGQFGGFNEDMYEKMFQLILRLKGNYMWPAMWSAIFSEDGKSRNTANAELADIYGIVMGTSHHEPMFRSGEEWSKIHQLYGDNPVWDFTTNRDAITKFWEDGVIRNKNFESLVTLGMRGERDSELGGGIEANIQLLKDIITTQKELLKKHGLEDAPQSLVIYKEVEKFWHGTDTVPGLKHWDVLDNVMIMLSDDNFGNVRTLPEENVRDRAAGWGLYYHFDYHGGPRSYEWVNSMPLEKTWEQMTMAYEFGIKELWVVNVGDLKPMEYPLSYFMDLAYDFETYGTSGINRTKAYTRNWARQQFGHVVNEEAVQGIASIVEDYSRMNGARKPEVVYSDTFSNNNYNEANRMLAEAMRIEAEASKYKELIPSSHQDAYYQLEYYPAVASAAVYKMQIYAGFNQKYYAFQNKSVLINEFADQVAEAIKLDESLQEYYNNSMSGGKWKGMMSSPHIGYTKWSPDGWQYPQVYNMTPVDGSLMIVDVEGTNQEFIAGTANLPAFTNLQKESYGITISNGGNQAFDYKIETSSDWITYSDSQGSIQTGKTIQVSVDWQKISATNEGELTITGAGQTVQLSVKAEVIDVSDLPSMTFVETHGVVSIEAEHTSNRETAGNAEWKVIENYGRTLSSLKMFPTKVSFENPEEAPYLEYSVYVSEDREYSLTTYTAPTNYLSRYSRLKYAVSIDGGQPVVADCLSPDHEPGYSMSWEKAVLDNIHTMTTTHALTKGLHTIRFYGMDAGVVLQKLVLSQEPLPSSYFGPVESYYTGQE